MKLYCIAGLIVSGEDLPESFRPFETETANKIDCRIQKSACEISIQKKALHTYQHQSFIVEKLCDGRWYYTSPPQLPPMQVLVSANYQKIIFYLPDTGCREQQQMQLTLFLRIALECRFIKKDIVALHSACVVYNGEAVAFSGESGIGKSTRAQHWAEFRDAKWLSGDRPAIKLHGDMVIACGVPWDGKEQIFQADEWPLKAILEVRRSSFCGLRRLSGLQAKRFLTGQCFIPMWDTQTAARAIHNIQVLAAKITVYRAFGSHKEEDAKAIKAILFDLPEKIGKEQSDMKIKKGFRLTKIVGEYMVLPTDENIRKFDGAVILNEVSAFIYEQLEKDISREDLLNLILTEFDVEPAVAKADLDALLEIFAEYGMLDCESNE